MILSISRRTDIPAFHARWFSARRREGFVEVPSDHGAPPRRIGLRADEVTGMVFWTRNPRPLFKEMASIREEGIPFYVTHTFTAHPRWLEERTPEPTHALGGMLEIASRFGPHALVWRFDPIVPTSITPLAWHAERFARIAAQLKGATDEVVISVVQSYAHADRNLSSAMEVRGASPLDTTGDEQRALVSTLAEAARENGMKLRVCCQPHLVVPGATSARCIDVDRLQRVADIPLPSTVRPTRPGCTCHSAIDIGRYDTCRHGCVYCYAVVDHGNIRTMGDSPSRE